MPTYRHSGSETMFSFRFRTHFHHAGLSDRFCSAYSSLRSLLSIIGHIIATKIAVCQPEKSQISVSRRVAADNVSLSGRESSERHWPHPIRYSVANCSLSTSCRRVGACPHRETGSIHNGRGEPRPYIGFPNRTTNCNFPHLLPSIS